MPKAAPLSLRPDYPGEEGDAALPRGKSASGATTRTFEFSTSRKSGSYKEFASGLYLSVMSQDSRSEQDAIADVRQAVRDATRFLESRFQEEGYRFQKTETPPRIRNESGAGWPKAQVIVNYSFDAPMERWKETRGDEEVELRGVRDPFSPVPFNFVEGLRKPLKNAISAKDEVWWDPGGLRWNVRRNAMAARVASKFRLASNPRRATMETNPLDGMRKPQALRTVNDILRRHTSGLFRDQYWKPIQDIRKDFERANIPLEALEGSGKYEKNNQGEPISKIWRYQVEFRNEKDSLIGIYIRIVAAGAGPVNNPLEVYDVVAYAS